MNTNKEDIKQYLLSVLDDPKLASGGRQITCRCHLGCGDTDRHLYIGPFDDSDSPILYNCFKCSCSTTRKGSGVVNEEFLENYGIREEFGKEIIKSNKGSKYKTFTKNKEYVYRIYNTKVTDCNMSRDKLDYINNRLGLSLTYQDCIDNKIVLNLVDLLSVNSINKFTRHPNIIRQLNDKFIGFLSRTNSSLNMRNLDQGNVHESIDEKYINYKVFDASPKYDFYIIPNIIDINNHIKVYIAEGPFDILSIYYNVVKDKTNSFFISGRGKAYYSAVEYLLLTYGIYDMEIHYYPDKDVPDKDIIAIAEFFRPYGFEIYIHRNVYENEKDFGVPANRIAERCMRVT